MLEGMTTMVLFTGAPGTGKSTMAEAAATALSASVLAWDWAMAGLTSFDDVQATFGQMDRARYRSVGWSIIWSLTTAQLRGGRSVVLDGVARDGEIDRFRQLADDFDVPSLVIWTHCSDRDVHRARVEHRVRDIPGWHELEWTHVESVRSTLGEPDDVDLRIDAVAPLAENETLLLRALAGT
jgi:predicted kinase